MIIATTLLSQNWPTFSLLATTLHFLLAFAVAFHCLRQPREPRSLLVWLFMVFTFPFLGCLLYLMFGINRVPSKAWDKAASDKLLDLPGDPDPIPLPPRIYREKITPASAPAHPSGLHNLLQRLYPDFPLLPGNHITPHLDPALALDAMLDAIRAARHHIHLQTYILGADPTGRRVMDLLRDKAQSGVTVRLMYDAFGSTRARWRRFFAPYASTPNLHILSFTQVSLLKRQFQINLRNHRKILILDGRLAFTGGVNLHHVYTGPHAARDIHFHLSGPAVLQLQYTFLCDWFYMASEPASALLTPKHFPLPHADGPALIRTLNAGSAEHPRRYEDAIFALLTTATRRLWLATPYFIPSDEILRALRNAALRGLDVCVLVPGRNNHAYVQYASRSAYAELLAAGVRVYERHPPFSHVKLLLADDTTTLFGSANLDNRSLRLNYETNCLAIDPALAHTLHDFFLREFANADEILPAAWQLRPLRQRLLENFCTLFNPVL